MVDTDCDFSLNISFGGESDFTWPTAASTSSKKTTKAPTISEKAVRIDNSNEDQKPFMKVIKQQPRALGRARLLAKGGAGNTTNSSISDHSNFNNRVSFDQNLKKSTSTSSMPKGVSKSSSGVLGADRKVSMSQKEKTTTTAKLPKPNKETIAATDYDSSEAPIVDFTDSSHEKKKPKYKTITAEEDPMRYHAKPKDLDGSESLLRPIATVSGSDYIFTKSSFSELNLDSRISDLLCKPKSENGFGLATATRVQLMSLPLLLERKNVLIRSETGSGKTLAYLLPILNDLISLPDKVSRNDGTRAIVVAPTRELCAQIGGVFEELSKCCVWIVGGCISGGEKKKSEKARLRKGVTLLVATPGRLLDHLKTTESFDLKMLRWIVFDEADRLLDMGFEQTILEILSIIRGEDLELLKERASVNNVDKVNSNNKFNSNAGASGDSHVGLNKRWQQHVSLMAKKCTDTDKLSHIMASATLTGAVRRLAGPVMGHKDFVIVDADGNKRAAEQSAKTSITMNSVETEEKILDFCDDEELAPVHEDMTPMQLSSSGFDSQERVEAPRQLQQYFMHVSCKWRLAALLSFLKQHSHQKVMVFFSTCDSVDYHSLLLKDAEWPLSLDDNTASDEGINHAKDFVDPPGAVFTGIFGSKCKLFRLHGSVPQKTRQEAFKSFCDAKAGIMLCTDVAARGLDLPHVDWILQYDPPCETTDYVHRIGRTARRGLGGSALIFLLPSESGYVSLLCSHGLQPSALSLQGLFGDTVTHVPGAAKFKNSDEMCAVILQRRMERTVIRNKHLTSAGRQAYRSFIRAYATHSSDSKGIFQVQLLHMGHLAKCFALSESITSLRNHDDTISKIMNGMYSAAILQSGDTAAQRKQARNQKYSLSEKRRSDDRQNIDRKRLRDENNDRGSGNKRLKIAGGEVRPDVGGGSSADASEPGSGKHSMKNRLAKAKASTQRVRKMGNSSGADASTPTPSGRFRKTSGYFKKQLRSQSTFEFTN